MNERLSESRSVTLDAAGSGTIILGPRKYQETWHIGIMTTVGNSAANPDMRVYRGTALLDTTGAGNADTSSTDIIVASGENLVIAYDLGTAGAVMTFTVDGTITRGI